MQTGSAKHNRIAQKCIGSGGGYVDAHGVLPDKPDTGKGSAKESISKQGVTT